eukprot:2951645-Alexandrium_andersonii.AAC.1
MTTPATARLRFQGTADDVVSALRPIVKPKGRSWLQYGEQPKAADARVDASAVAAAHEVLDACHSLQENLSFPKLMLGQVVRALYEENASDPRWALKPND